MCDAPWTSGCKQQDIAVILQNAKGEKLYVCRECWNKVPKNWKWGKRKRRTRAEIAVDVIDAIIEGEDNVEFEHEITRKFFKSDCRHCSCLVVVPCGRYINGKAKVKCTIKDCSGKQIKEKTFDNYIPFGKHAWIRKDVWERMQKASKKELDEIMKEGEKSLRDEVNRSKKRRKKRGKRRKRKRKR